MNRGSSLRLMLLTLVGAFALSQAYRTIAGVLSPALQHDLNLTGTQLGTFAAMFHLVFAAAQLFMGGGIDVYGVRRVVLSVFPFTIIGSLISALAPSYEALLLGQGLIGIGC